MNKNAFLITVTLASSLFWAGCNKSGKLDQASTFTTPTGPLELKLKWPAGEHVLQSFDMKLNMELSVPNQPAPIQRDITLGQEYGLTVLNYTAGGGHAVRRALLNCNSSAGWAWKPKKPQEDARFSRAGKASDRCRAP